MAHVLRGRNRPRDAHLRAAGADSLEDFLRDYRYVRIGDLASLAFCNNWARVMAARRLRPGRKSMTAVAAPRCDDPVMRIRIYSLSTLVALTLAPAGLAQTSDQQAMGATNASLVGSSRDQMNRL